MPIELTHDQLDEHIKISREKNQPLMIDGAIGIGKSQHVKTQSKEHAESNDREFVEWNELPRQSEEGLDKEEVKANPEEYHAFMDIRLSMYDPSDVKGLPDFSEDSSEIIWHLSEWANHVTRENAAGTVFFDEVNLAEPSVQTAFYQVIQQHQVSEHSISDDVYVLAAGNRAGKDRANVYEMAGPLRDRFARVELKPPVAGEDGNWIDWAIENDIDERIVGFLSSPSFMDHLYNFDDRKDQKVFATPRSWAKASNIIEGIEDRDLIAQLLSSVVGEGIAQEFRGFLDLRDDADLEEIMQNPEEIRNLATESGKPIDFKYSVVSGLAAKYREDTQALESLVKVSKHMHDANDTEFAILMLRLAAEYRKSHFKKNVHKIDEFDDVYEEFRDYVDPNRKPGQ